jgi:hypothetical protein
VKSSFLTFVVEYDEKLNQKSSRRINNPWSLNYGHFLKIPFHNLPPQRQPYQKLQTSQKKQKLKKAELTAGSSFGSSAIFDLIRSAAFCPLLTEGLALSGVKQNASEGTKNPLEASRWILLETSLHTIPQKGQGLGCEVDLRQVGTNDLKILPSEKEVKRKIVFCPDCQITDFYLK